MYPVRKAAAVSMLALASLGVGVGTAAAQGVPPPAPPGRTAEPNPLPPGMPAGQAYGDMPLPVPPAPPATVPPVESRTYPDVPPPAPPPVSAPAPGPVSAPVIGREVAAPPALPPSFRVLTSEDTPPAVKPGPKLTAAPEPFPQPQPPPTTPSASPNAAPFLVVEKHGPTSVKLGQPLVYEVLVKNTGSGPVAGIHLQDEVPAGTKLIATLPPAVVQGTHLVWLIDMLPRGSEARFRVELQPTAPGDIASRASVIVFSGEVRTTVLGTNGLGLTLTAPETTTVGQTVMLKIQIANQLPQAVHKIHLRGHLPEGMQHPYGEGREIEADMDNLEAGQTRTVELKVTAVHPGRLVSEVALTAEGGLQATSQATVVVLGTATESNYPPPPPPPSPTPSAPLSPAAAQTDGTLVVRKKGQQRLVQGQAVDYQIEVLNKSDSEANNVLLQDKLPAGLDFVSGSRGVTFDAANRTILWAPGLLAPNQSTSAWVKLVPKNTGELINLVTVQGDNRPEARLVATLTVGGRSVMPFSIPGFSKQR